MGRYSPLLRKLAWQSGALSVARTRLRHALTVVMLHRVLDPADPDLPQADPTYTLTLPVFDELLDFLQAHYAIVSIHDVMAAYRGDAALPDHALLITFDDGWADNLRYAAPSLLRRGMPAIVFIVAGQVQSTADAWWQERLFAARRAGVLGRWLDESPVAAVLGDIADPQASSSLDIIVRLGALDDDEREALLRTLPSAPCSRRMMLQPADLTGLVGCGVDIGTHGLSHLPLTSVPDVAAELSRAGAMIAAMSGGLATGYALGCPHGRYDGRVVAGARAAGIRLIFTSDPHLNATQRGRFGGERTLGRINLIERHLADGGGRLDPAAAARWLWAREVQ